MVCRGEVGPFRSSSDWNVTLFPTLRHGSPQLNNVRLCETVIGSVDNARKLNRDIGGGGLTGDEIYWRADRVTYKYYLGRLRLFQHRVRLVS